MITMLALSPIVLTWSQWWQIHQEKPPSCQGYLKSLHPAIESLSEAHCLSRSLFVSISDGQHGLAQRGRSWREVAQGGPHPVHQCGPLVRFVRDALVELGTDDHLGHPSVRTRGETVADPGIDIETTDLEINNAIEIVLLLIERHEILQRAEVRVVFEPER